MSFTQHLLTLDESHKHLILKLNSKLSYGVDITGKDKQI